MTNPPQESSSQPTPRRWLQYRLRTLLVAVLLVSLAGSWFHREREAVRAREAIAFKFHLKAGAPQPAWHLRLFGPDALGTARVLEFECESEAFRFTDADAAAIRGLPSLEEVLLNGSTDVSDRGFEDLVTLPSLKRLLIAGIPMSDDRLLQLTSNARKLRELAVNGRNLTSRGHAGFANLKDLQSLFMYEAKVNDADLQYFAKLTDMRELTLPRAPITGIGFVHLAGMTKMEKLVLQLCPLTGVGFEHLAGMTNLQTLDLWYTRITGTAFLHLAGATKLKSVNLSWTPFDEAGLPALAGMTQLESINLVRTRVTGTGFEVFENKPKLVWLALSNSKFTGRGLRYLPDGPRNKELCFENCPILDEELADLTQRKHLETLDLRKTPISDAGLKHVAQVKSLRFLRLDDCPNITAEGLKEFKRHPNLSSLSICRCRKLGDGLVHLAGLPLNHLSAENADLTDAQLAVIKQVPTLVHLWIHDNPRITDQILPVIGALPKLRNVNALRTGITMTGGDAFQQTYGRSIRHH
jgi:hypothetical protein